MSGAFTVLFHSERCRQILPTLLSLSTHRYLSRSQSRYTMEPKESLVFVNISRPHEVQDKEMQRAILQ